MTAGFVPGTEVGVGAINAPPACERRWRVVGDLHLLTLRKIPAIKLTFYTN